MIRKICAILPHGAVYGGVKRYIESGNEFIRMGYDYAIATANPAEWDWFPFHGRSFTIDQRPKEEAWDAVILTNPTLADQVGKFNANLVIVNVINGSYAREGYQKAIRMLKPDLVVACSTSVGKLFPECHSIIPGAVDRSIFSPRDSFDLHDPIRILAYGRKRNPRKRVDEAIAIFQEIKRKSKYPVELHLFDSKDKISSEGIRFHFGLFRHDLARLYRSMDLFISPEEQAGWHNTAAEAMSCGLPVLCTQDGTMDFAVHGESALVSKVGDKADFVSNAMRIIEDTSMRMRLIEGGVRKIGEFTWRRYNEQYLHAINGLIQSKAEAFQALTRGRQTH